MVSFTYRRSKSADAYTVAAHYGVLRVAVLMKCVVPFLIPDALKIALAVVITKTVPKYVKIFD